MIDAGLRLKTSRTALSIRNSGTGAVPKVSTMMLTGSAIPMAYAICTSQRRASRAATTFFATQRAAYAADRSPYGGMGRYGRGAVAHNDPASVQPSALFATPPAPYTAQISTSADAAHIQPVNPTAL